MATGATTNYSLPYPKSTDSVTVASDIQALATAVDTQLLTQMNTAVKLTGDQSVAGTKTFSSSPVVPTVDVTDNSTKAASTAYVRSVVDLTEDPHPAENLLKQAVWYIDAKDSGSTSAGAVNLGWGGTALNAAQGTAGNQPKKLDYAGTPYIYVPFATNNNISVPASSGTYYGDVMDIRLDLACDDWQLADTYWAGRGTSAAGPTTFSWVLGTTTTNRLYFSVTDGTTTALWRPTVLAGFTDDNRYQIRATYTRDTGAGQYAMEFSYRSDGNIESDTGWTSLASTTGTSIGATVDGGYDTLIGTYRNATAGFAGKYYKALMKVGGTLAFYVDTSVVTGSSTTFTARTGQTVAVNRAGTGRKIVCVTAPVYLFGTDDWLEVPDNAYLNFNATDQFSIVAVYRPWATITSGQIIIAKSAANGANPISPRWLIRHVTGNQVVTYLDDGVSVPGAGNVQTAGATSVLAAVVSSTTYVQYYNSAISNTATRPAGTLTNTTPMRVGSAGSAVSDMEFTAAAIFRRALTADEIALISDYFKGRIA